MSRALVSVDCRTICLSKVLASVTDHVTKTSQKWHLKFIINHGLSWTAQFALKQIAQGYTLQ